MNFIGTMLSKKIIQVEPTLDISGSDRKVLQVAIQDFMSYLKFNWRLLEETNIPFIADKIEKLYEEDPVEVDSVLTVWTGLWLKKWKKRVNLLIGKKSVDESSKTPEVAKAEALWVNLDCREEIVGIVTATLIKNAEICGTRIIAENLLKMELRKKIDRDMNDKQQLVAILNNVLRQAREITQKIGPLISIKVDKNYYCQVKS